MSEHTTCPDCGGPIWASGLKEVRYLHVCPKGGDANDAGVRSEHSADVTPPAGDDRLREIRERLKEAQGSGAWRSKWEYELIWTDAPYLLAEVERLQAEWDAEVENAQQMGEVAEQATLRLRALEAACLDAANTLEAVIDIEGPKMSPTGIGTTVLIRDRLRDALKGEDTMHRTAFEDGGTVGVFCDEQEAGMLSVGEVKRCPKCGDCLVLHWDVRIEVLDESHPDALAERRTGNE